jgi:hypothetical protein
MKPGGGKPKFCIDELLFLPPNILKEGLAIFGGNLPSRLLFEAPLKIELMLDEPLPNKGY